MQHQKYISREEMVNKLELPDGHLENPCWPQILERLSTRVEDLGVVFEASSDTSSEICVPFTETGNVRRDKSGKKILPIDFTMSQAMELFPVDYIVMLEKYSAEVLNDKRSARATDISAESMKVHEHEEDDRSTKLDIINKMKVFIEEEFPAFEPGDESLKKLNEALKIKKPKNEGSEEAAWWLYSHDYSEFVISPPGIVQEQELCTPPPSTYTLIDRKRCESWIDQSPVKTISSPVKNKK